MKRVGRWTWMLLTLLLLLCASVLAADEKTYIELDETVEAVLTNNDRMDFYLDIPVDGMRMLVDWQSEETCNIYISGKTRAYTTNADGNTVLGVQKAGEYTVTVYDNSLKQGETRTVRFMLREYKNDAQEPNDVTPTELHDGDAISFTLDGGDRDQFAFTTTKPGQDIALTFGGFYYADRTSFKLSGIGTSYTIDGNGTVFLHAGEPGAYQFSLYMFYMSGDGEISRSMEVHLLDGDENELNDTKETATPLPIGTDAAFSIGGINDEDWFSFEAVPEEGKSKIYTLRLLDFDPENSETVSYKIYAPDGSVVAGNSTSSRHTRVFSCSQQGQYTIKLSASDIQRTLLRIRVEEGGDDPYESNDTWIDAAYIEPGQLISHVLNSGDTDWFCFTVPEDHMTLHVSSDCAGVSASGYTGRDLAEYGESAKTIWSERYKSASNLYWKLDEKELYYIRLSGGSSEKICSTMISLLPPDEIEDNDAWYRATPLYEDVVQAFDLSAPNDTEWFRFTVLTGSQKVLLLDITKTDTGDDVHDSAYADFNLYREVYFNGQDDSSLYRFRLDNTYWPTSKRCSWNLEPGTYYLSVAPLSARRVQTLSIGYKILPQLGNDTIATAAPLTEKVWQDVWQDGYFSIGEHKAGEVVQIQRDEGGSEMNNNIVVYDADEQKITYSYRGSFSFRIPADGVYYLRIPEFDVPLNAENEPMRPIRIRYYTHNDKIGAAESIAMRPNESVFLDLWFSPEIRNSLKVESEDEALTYDLETGYLTAPNTPEGGRRSCLLQRIPGRR